jgi:transposase-like protein
MDGEMVNLTPRFVEADEIWSFVGSKQKNVPEGKVGEYGDIWTWTAIDAETKLIPTWLVGERITEDCYYFLNDLKLRCKPGHRFQLTTDGFGAYPGVVDALWREGIDYAVIIRDYTENKDDHR